MTGVGSSGKPPLNGISNVYGSSSSKDFHMIIIGAGSSGLLIAQGLKKNGIRYSIFEKETAAQRPRDWGMAYFWSADYLPKLLPPELVERLPEAQVDPHYKAQDVEIMTVTNGQTGEDIKYVPSPGGRRVGRRALRRLVGEGINIYYDHKLASITYPTPSTVTAIFHTGLSVTGNLLIGADGGGSVVRRHLLGPLAEPTPLPYHMVNFNASYRKPEQARYIRENIRHFVDHGVHPKGMFMLMTLQSVPDPNDPTTWSFQITMTWPPSLAPDPAHPGPPHSLKDLQTLAADWASPKREALAWLSDAHVTTTAGFNHTEKSPLRPQSQLSAPTPATKLRPAKDVLNRLLWDPSTYNSSDYVVGYSDRFKGTIEIPLSAWKQESTDEEFIPQHRIEYFRAKDEVEILWHRECKIDRVFGSGVALQTTSAVEDGEEAVVELQEDNDVDHRTGAESFANGAAKEKHSILIPSDRISIWSPIPWDNHDGRITLCGDAAHCMTFHRGQGLNNCIRDAKELVDAIVAHTKEGKELSARIDAYEAEMRDRGAAEVRLSKEQTEKEHDWEKFQDSPIMRLGGRPVRPVESRAWRELGVGAQE